MLRRKLLIRIGLLIGAFVCGAVVAIWLLQGALADIDRTNRDAAVLIGGIQTVGGAVGRIQSAMETPDSVDPHPELAGAIRTLNEAIQSIGSHEVARGPAAPAGPAYIRLVGLLPAFIAQSSDPERMHSRETLTTSMAVGSAVQELALVLREHVAQEQTNLGRYFRALVLGLTLAALVMVNVAILVLLRTAQVVLKPVAALVEGSRELAAEHFDHRVDVGLQDEFGELARAYNHLAEQLEANEERKAETLRQLAVTLNHDLNNAMAVIELQLGLLDRRTGGNPTLARHLHDIRTNLARMSGTVASLKNIRRVVLTEYGPGQKMLDIERSVEPGPVGSGSTEHAA